MTRRLSVSGYVIKAPFINGKYTKGFPFLPKMVYKRLRGMDLGAEPPLIIPPGNHTLSYSTFVKKKNRRILTFSQQYLVHI